MNLVKAVVCLTIAFTSLSHAQNKPEVVVIPLLETTSATSIQPGAGSLVLDDSNFSDSGLQIEPGSFITIDGRIFIRPRSTQLNEASLIINGGSFTSTSPTRVLELGEQSVISGVTFERLTLDVQSPVTFINCVFERVMFIGNASSIYDSIIQDSRPFSSASNPGVIESISNSLIEDSDLLVKKLEDSTINESTIAEAQLITGSTFNGSFVDLTSEISNAKIINNTFNNIGSRTTIEVDASSFQSNARILSINNNDFILGDRSRAVSISGINRDAIISISNNNIIGDERITNLDEPFRVSGNATTLINNNYIEP